MKDVIISQDKLENLLIRAFNKGQLWGECFQGWFTPTDEQHKDERNNMLKELLINIK